MRTSISPQQFCDSWHKAYVRGWTVRQLANYLHMDVNVVQQRRRDYIKNHFLTFKPLAEETPQHGKTKQLQRILDKGL